MQAVANQQPQKPTHILSWIIHHPIQWIRGLDEWKHFSSIGNIRNNNNRREGRRTRWREFNSDPLLFPSTWMPLRWLQIYAITKAFATDPEQFKWCSPDKQTVIVHRLMNIYLIQLSLGDEWSRVFLGEYRVGLGIVVVTCYFIGKKNRNAQSSYSVTTIFISLYSMCLSFVMDGLCDIHNECWIFCNVDTFTICCNHIRVHEHQYLLEQNGHKRTKEGPHCDGLVNR